MKHLNLLLILLFPLFMSAQSVHFYADSVTASPGSFARIDVKVRNFDLVAGFQGTLRFDTSKLEFLSFPSFAVLSPALNALNFDASKVSQGYITYLWQDPSLNGESLADSSILFGLLLKTKAGSNGQAKLYFDNSPTLLELTDTALSVLSAQYDSLCIQIQTSISFQIANGGLNNTVFCPGDTICFPFSANGNYGSNNRFRLEMSDTLGVFNGTTYLGFKRNLTDTIKAIIPINATSAKRYRFRVVSTNPIITGADNGTDVVVLEKPNATWANLSDVCEYDIPFQLNGGMPLGGVYGGPGVSNGFFDPTSVGPGSYDLIYVFTNADGCSDTASASILVHPKPPKPTIQKFANQLQSSASTGNQWLQGGTSIVGARGQTFVPVSNGVYQVIVILNGCVSDTSEFVLFNVGFSEIIKAQIKVYPNPSHATVVVEHPIGLFNTIALVGMDGRRVLYAEIEAEAKSNINLSGISQGVYLLELEGDEYKEVRRLIIQR